MEITCVIVTITGALIYVLSAICWEIIDPCVECPIYLIITTICGFGGSLMLLGLFSFGLLEVLKCLSIFVG